MRPHWAGSLSLGCAVAEVLVGRVSERRPRGPSTVILYVVTLIVSVLTEQYVALVSDRRTTWTQEDVVTRQEDTDTKTFNMYGQFLMGFSGLARINGLRIERWVGHVLAQVPSHEYFNVLKREIDIAFCRLGCAGKIPHAFLAAGYTSLQPGGHIYPINVIISNSIDHAGKFSAQALSDHFTIYWEPLGNRRRVIHSVGWPMRESTMLALTHRIRVVTKGPLVTALRDTARISKNYVGQAALFASLPRQAVPCPSVTIGEVDFRKTTASLFLPEGARNADKAVTYAPACISSQMHMMGLKVYSGMSPLGREEGWA
jgi:hypothetical protein